MNAKKEKGEVLLSRLRVWVGLGGARKKKKRVGEKWEGGEWEKKKKKQRGELQGQLPYCISAKFKEKGIPLL